MSLSISITDAKPSERNFVRDSWRRSLQGAPAYRMPHRAFEAWVNGVMDDLLGADETRIELYRADMLLVARDAERPVFAYGWLLARDMQPGLALIYAATKPPFQRMGVASALLAEALERAGAGDNVYCTRLARVGAPPTAIDSIWEGLGFKFMPLHELELPERESA